MTVTICLPATTICLPATELVSIDAMASVETMAWRCRLCDHQLRCREQTH
jgi:hypothetical protein